MKFWPPPIPMPEWPFGKGTKKLPLPEEEEEGEIVSEAAFLAEESPEKVSASEETSIGEDTSGLLVDDLDEADLPDSPTISVDDVDDFPHAEEKKSSNVLSTMLYYIIVCAMVIMTILLSSAAIFHLARMLHLPAFVAETSGIITAVILTCLAAWKMISSR